MSLGNDKALAAYTTEFILAFSENTVVRIRAVWAAFYDHGFEVDQIAEVSGFPSWRVRQVIFGTAPEPEPESEWS